MHNRKPGYLCPYFDIVDMKSSSDSIIDYVQTNMKTRKETVNTYSDFTTEHFDTVPKATFYCIKVVNFT